jgi:uncharacterized protein YigE (DUF2233 family)
MRLKFIVILVIIAGLIVFLRTNNSTPSTQIQPTGTPTETVSPTQRPSGVQSSWFIVDNPAKLTLHSNLEDKLTALEAKERYGCENIINGGFYTKEDTHIGLFVEDGKELSRFQENSLFNGIFSIENTIPLIAQVVPLHPKLALQTGPILMKDNNIWTLKLTRDENARRMVLGITNDKQIVFITFYDSSSLASGPELVDLPNLVKEFADNNDLHLTDAINLDGGAHSTFISDEVQLTDIQTPGSYFCVKN